MNKIIASIILLAGCLAGTLKFKVKVYNDCAEKRNCGKKDFIKQDSAEKDFKEEDFQNKDFQKMEGPRTGDDISLVAPTTMVVASGSDSDGVPGRYVATNIASRIITNAWVSLKAQNRKSWFPKNPLNVDLTKFLETVETLIKEGMKNHLEEVARCMDVEMNKDLLKTGSELQPNKPSPSVILTVANILNTELGDRLQIFQRGGSHVLVLRPAQSSEPGRFYYAPVFFSEAAFTDPNSPRLYAASAGLKPLPTKIENGQQNTDVLEIITEENDIVVVGSEVLFNRLPLPLITFIVNSHLAVITFKPTESQPNLSYFDKHLPHRKYEKVFMKFRKALQRMEVILPRNLVERAQKNANSGTVFGQAGLYTKPTPLIVEQNPLVITPLSANTISQNPQPILSEDLAQEEALPDPEEINSDFLIPSLDPLTKRDLKNRKGLPRNLPFVEPIESEFLQEIEILPDNKPEKGYDLFENESSLFPFSNDSGNHWFSGPRKLLLENPLGHKKELPARRSGSGQRLLMRESNSNIELGGKKEDRPGKFNNDGMDIEEPDNWLFEEKEKLQNTQFGQKKSMIMAWANSLFEIPLEELLNLSCYADSAFCARIHDRPGLISWVAANALSNIFNFSEDVLPTIRKNLSAEQLSEELVAAGVQIFELKTPFYSPEFVRRFLANKPTDNLFSPETGFAVTAAVVVSDPVVFSPTEFEKIINGSRQLKNYCYRFLKKVQKRKEERKKSEKSDPVSSPLLAAPKMKKISKPTLDRKGRIEKQAALRRKSESDDSDHQLI